uniref:Uncharacterized protein n=1 Tax=Nelumbo nucifera TaxID=4432 RepID=A0A822YPC2_NELNU|nr:TPA_asm: hypothetical protein HUJ06_006674 [Nelumbo nucifera]
MLICSIILYQAQKRPKTKVGSSLTGINTSSQTAKNLASSNRSSLNNEQENSCIQAQNKNISFQFHP